MNNQPETTAASGRSPAAICSVIIEANRRQTASEMMLNGWPPSRLITEAEHEYWMSHTLPKGWVLLNSPNDPDQPRLADRDNLMKP